MPIDLVLLPLPDKEMSVVSTRAPPRLNLMARQTLLYLCVLISYHYWRGARMGRRQVFQHFKLRDWVGDLMFLSERVTCNCYYYFIV